ncbi:MAG: response regulator [Pleurocapsa minor GSE-CHR-MK-17-07R]|jgi:pilus assembly protein CpaE|nr:response regulator [Pleurocapsa minor GSE-CHR-MK 17-07R]
MAEKILVVDDDLDSLKLIGLMLQRNGYEVSAASAGSQALAKASTERPDLIILDVMMPDMSGLEVCRRLRKNPDTKGIPIIMFTAKTLIDDKVAGFEAGADDYLTKPTHPAELASRVKAMLARNVTPPVKGGVGSGARGATIGVLGAKGGVGTSTLAMNIAAARHMAGDNPILADFRPGVGSTGLFLGLGRSTGMMSVLSKPLDEIRPKLIESELAVHTSGLRTLLSSPRPREAGQNFAPEAPATVLKALRSMGKPIVIDLGAGMSPVAGRLQGEIDHLVIVVDPLSVTLSMARELLQELDSARPDSTKTHVVVVSRAASSNPPTWNDIEQTIGREIRAIIALASELALHAQQSQVPIVMYQPTAIASSQMIKLADEIATRIRNDEHPGR